MNISLDSRRRPAQVTIVSALVLLTLTFWFPGGMLVHSGVVVLVGLTIMMGRRVSNMATAWLALATTAMFISAGFVFVRRQRPMFHCIASVLRVSLCQTAAAQIGE